MVMYHSVVDGPRPYTLWTQLPVGAFRQQLRHLQEHFRILPLSEVVERLRGGQSLPANSAVVTFDDGFRNNCTQAFPVLQELGVPAAVMLTTGFLDGGEPNWTDRLFLALRGAPAGELDLSRFGLPPFVLGESTSRMQAYDEIRMRCKGLPAARKSEIVSAVDDYAASPGGSEPEFAADFAPLSWEQVSAMASSGLVEFGAHTVHHEILSQLPRDAARAEIAQSCATVRERLELDRVAFAYPNGRRQDFDDHCKAVLHEVGATCALSTIEGLCAPGDDLFEMRRIGVGSDMTMDRFAVMCSGLASSLKATLGRS